MAVRLKHYRYITDEGCWEWTGVVNSVGYGQIHYHGKTITVHRLVARLLLGHTSSSGKIVTHTCNNRLCFNPQHLKLGTYKENTEYMAQCGRAGWQTYRRVPVALLEEWGINPDTLTPKE